MYMFKKNKLIKQRIEDFLGVVNHVLDLYQESMSYYIEHHLDDHFHTLIEKTHQAESKADDLRREIESELFHKSLLPEMREDLITVIENMDKVPNTCEKVLRRIYTHNIILPDELDPKVIELVRLGVECCRPLREAVIDVLGPCRRIRELAREIDSNESVADQLEHELLYMLFHGEYEPLDRILYRDIILWIAGLPDKAERISDQLTILAIKRNV